MVSTRLHAYAKAKCSADLVLLISSALACISDQEAFLFHLHALRLLVNT